MTARIGDIVIDSIDPRRAAEFWAAALGYRITASDGSGVAVAGHPAAPTLLFVLSSDPKRHKNRLHFDICPVHSTRESEVHRLTQLGAVTIATRESWTVMTDPDGNEFCVMDTVLPPEPEPFHDP